jgi:hypothetical protein
MQIICVYIKDEYGNYPFEVSFDKGQKYMTISRYKADYPNCKIPTLENNYIRMGVDNYFQYAKIIEIKE